MLGLESDPTAERQGRLDGDAVPRHRQIATGKTVTMHIAGHGQLAAEGIVDLLPIDHLRLRTCVRRQQRCKSEKNEPHLVIMIMFLLIDER
jgi:hypothetical protein